MTAFIRAYAAFADEFANADPFYVPTVNAGVAEPNARLNELLLAPRKLTALEWSEVERLAGEDDCA